MWSFLSSQLAAVHLSDASYLTDPSKYVSVLLLSLRTMLQLEMPHINVLSKMDVITKLGDLRASFPPLPLPYPAASI
jgi:hypothetical protein